MEAPSSSGMHWILCTAPASSTWIPMSSDCNASTTGWDVRGTPRWCAQCQAVNTIISWVVNEANWIWKWLRGSKYRPAKSPYQSLSGVRLCFEGLHTMLRLIVQALGGLRETRGWLGSETGKGTEVKIKPQLSAPLMAAPRWFLSLPMLQLFPPHSGFLLLFMSFFIVLWKDFFFNIVQLNLFHQQIFLFPMDSLKGFFWRCISIQMQAFV